MCSNCHLKAISEYCVILVDCGISGKAIHCKGNVARVMMWEDLVTEGDVLDGPKRTS